MGRTGSADLPLHGGHVPAWLSERMAKLGRVVAQAIVLEYGRGELLARLAHPFWFQSLGCVMGMDWHSSGITTSVLGALKRGLAPVADELGVHVCGGRGRHSRRTPDELTALGERLGLDGDRLARTSRLTAKVDSAAVQDGFQLYLHGFILADDGAWVVVQQGMNPSLRAARRYHWISERVRDFVDEPHAAIEGAPTGTLVNLTDRRARASRDSQLALVAGDLDRVVEAARARPHLQLPAHHDVRPSDVVLRRLRGTLEAAAARAPEDFAELLLTPGLGARTVRALALVAEVVHGAPCRFTDPARFSLAHGGKDGHPFPVPLAVYDRTLSVMRHAVEQASLGNDERLSALRRLDAESRRLERAHTMTPADFATLVADEWHHSPEWAGRTVHGDAPAPPREPSRPRESQLALPGL
jgi:hypothetical protein